MAVIYFDGVVIRERDDQRPVLFSWPRTGESFTYTVSTDNGANFSAGAGTITENDPDGDVAEYAIPYLEAERPSATGIVVYAITDGTDSAKVYVNVLSGKVAFTAPSLPAGDAFTSLEEMQRLFSVEGIDNFTEDYTPNDDVINEIIVRAKEKVLQFLRGRYTEVDMAASWWVRDKATHIAVHYLCRRRGNPGLYREDYEEALLDLALARDGAINPGLNTDHRLVVQTPMIDNRFFTPARINPQRSTRTYGNQRLPYLVSSYSNP